MTISTEFTVAVTHFLKGMPRLTVFRRRTNRQLEPSSAMTETQRRLEVIEHLRRLHAFASGHDGASSGNEDRLPPDAWINEQLGNLREPWRVQNVDGYRYEVYEARC